MSFISTWRLTVVLVFIAVSAFFWVALEGYTLRWEFALIPLLFSVQIVLADFVEYYLLSYMGLRGRWFSIVMAPGTILHELSHLIAALFTGCTITDVSFFKYNPKSNVLGYVDYLQPKDRWVVLRTFLIGFSPFFACGILLVALNYLVSWDALILDEFSSAETVFENVFGMASSYYNTSINPILLGVLAYFSVCFALGAAPSMADMKGFFWSMPKHLISSLFFLALIFTVINLGEVRIELFGYALSGILVLLFDLAVYIQLASIAVFIAAIPLLLVSDKFIELSLDKRVFVFSAAALAYAVSGLVLGFSARLSALAAAAVFIISLVFFRWPGLFLKSGRSSSSRS